MVLSGVILTHYVFGEVNFSWLLDLLCVSKYLRIERKKMEAD